MNHDLSISFSVTFGKYFFFPSIWSHFHPLRLKKNVKYLGSNLIFCHALNLGCCSHFSSALILAVDVLCFFLENSLNLELTKESKSVRSILINQKKTGKDNYNGKKGFLDV